MHTMMVQFQVFSSQDTLFLQLIHDTPALTYMPLATKSLEYYQIDNTMYNIMFINENSLAFQCLAPCSPQTLKRLFVNSYTIAS